MALHVLPVGVSYHIRPSILCICIVEDCVLQLVQLCLSLSLSGLYHGGDHLLVLSQLRLSLWYIKGSYHQKKKVGYSFWNKVLFYYSLKITDNLLIQLQFNNHTGRIQREEGIEIHTLLGCYLPVLLQWLRQWGSALGCSPEIGKRAGSRRGDAFRALPRCLWARWRTPKCSERLPGAVRSPTGLPQWFQVRVVLHCFYIPHVSCVGLIKSFFCKAPLFCRCSSLHSCPSMGVLRYSSCPPCCANASTLGRFCAAEFLHHF